MTGQLPYRLDRIFCIAAMTVWLAWGYPVLRELTAGATIRGYPVPATWLVPYALFGAAVLAAMALRLRPGLLWTLLCVQLAAVVAMAILLPWAGMSQFLVIIAWQVAMATSPARALGWVAFQTLAIVAALVQALNPDLCWVIVKSFALQLVLVFTAVALRREAETSRALAQTNRELRSAQAIIANSVRDAERLRISRELHDAWGHELTALGLQLEIASHIAEPGRANDHVMQAKGPRQPLPCQGARRRRHPARGSDRCELKAALRRWPHSVPTPAIHVGHSLPACGSPPSRPTALMRCAQESRHQRRHAP
jgi:hypothetical protein